jgi:hypothetical protein
VQVEGQDDTPVGVLAPRAGRHGPHDLELVAVGVAAIERLADHVVRGARQGPDLAQRVGHAGQLLHRVDLPREVVETDGPAHRPGRVRADLEEAQVVVVAAHG